MYSIFKIHFIIVALFILTGCIRSTREFALIRLENADEDYQDIIDAPYLGDTPLTLDEILCIVIERNLDLLVKEKEYEYQVELLTGAKLKTLPSLIFSGEISGRDRNTGIFSESLEPGVPPAPPSISQDQNVNRYDLTFAWNLLDFGISYYRSRQAASKAIIKQMEYARLRQRLIQDTVEVYWKARSALHGLIHSQALIEEAQNFMNFIYEQIAKQVAAKDLGLIQERDILRQGVLMQLYQKEYDTAMQDLAKLMGYPYADFILAEDEIPDIDISLPERALLERLALENRPELYGLDMEGLTALQEAKIAMLQIFPSITGFVGRFFDSNSFLIFNRWISGGLRYSLNLLAIPYHIQDYRSEIEHYRAIKYERLAVSVGILTQVNLAWMSYLDSKQEYEIVNNLAQVNQDLLRAMEQREQEGGLSGLEVLVNYKYNALFSEVEALRSYGSLRSAVEQINTSIGIPFYLRVCKDDSDE